MTDCEQVFCPDSYFPQTQELCELLLGQNTRLRMLCEYGPSCLADIFLFRHLKHFQLSDSILSAVELSQCDIYLAVKPLGKMRTHHYISKRTLTWWKSKSPQCTGIQVQKKTLQEMCNLLSLKCHVKWSTQEKKKKILFIKQSSSKSTSV